MRLRMLNAESYYAEGRYVQNIGLGWWGLPVFLATEGRPLYCVLLLGEAHFGCMVSMAAPRPGHSGQIGFQFEAVPEDSIRLIHGLIDGMKSRLQEQAAIAEEI